MRRLRAPSRALRTLAVAVLAAAASCGRGAPISEETEEIGRAAAPSKPSPEAAAHAAWAGPRVFDIPLYPGADEATTLVAAMRVAWVADGEPAALFPARFGERVFETADEFEQVLAFYRPLTDNILMDHTIENGGHHHSQRLFTAIATAPDGTLVKLTISRPFFRYPDRLRIDRTVIQIGRVGRGT